MRTIRRADAGLAGNGGQFAPTARGDVPIDLLPTPQTATGREIMLDPEVDDLAKSVETSFDADGRSVMIIGIDREQLPTSSYRRSEEHTSELQSRGHLVCRLLLEKKKTYIEK